MFFVGIFCGVNICWLVYVLFAPQELEFTLSRVKANWWFRYSVCPEVCNIQLEDTTNDDV